MNNIIIGLGIVFFIVFVALTPSTPVDLVSPTHHISNKVLNPDLNTLYFDDQTLKSGLFNVHLQGDHKLTGLNEALGAGVCAFDYDNDGWTDLFIVGGSGQTRFYGKQHWWQQAKGNRLFRNLGQGKFEDVTKSTGLNLIVWGMGCSTGDLDNDGDQELFVSTYQENYLFENNGNGTFNNISRQSGIQGKDWSTSVTMADYDNDGLLDIYVANYLRYEKGAKTFESHSGFKLGKLAAFNASLYDGVANQLWRNEGNLVFSNVAHKASVDNESGRSLSALWIHLDDDHFPDLYVLNDAGFPNQLYKNNGDSTFTEVGAKFDLNFSDPSASAAIGDINNDGMVEISVSSNSGQLSKLYQRKGKSFQYKDRARDLNLGIEQYVNLEGWSQSFSDFNNDGWTDLLMVNGLHTPDPISPKLTQGQSTLVQMNSDGNGFKAVLAKDSIALSDGHSSRGASVADFDNDGDLDIYISNNNDLGQYLKNNTEDKNHWIRLNLQGTKSNRDAIGSRVWIEFEQGNPLIQHFRNGGFLSQHEDIVHVGLGSSIAPVNITVQWPNGDKQRFNQIPIDQSILLVEGKDAYQVRGLKPSSNQVKPPFNITALSSSEKIMLLDLYSELNNQTEYIRLLKTQIKDANRIVRKNAIKHISKDRSMNTLGLLISTLTHEDLETRLAALDALSLREEEHSSRWLLRQFSNDSPEIKESLAKIYEFFFHEEEAVIYRKQLAVPHLLEYLKDESMRVRVAAARALGESESFRAVDALVNLLHDKNVNTRAEATRALGKIRERHAISPLKSLISDINEVAIVKAHALIALKRLNYEGFSELLSSFLPAILNSTSLQHIDSNIEALHNVINTVEDGIVISPKIIKTHVSNWFMTLSESVKQSLKATTLVNVLKIIQLSSSKENITLLNSLIAHEDENVRAISYSQLLQFNYSQKNTLVKKAVRDESDLVKLAIIDSSTKLNVELPNNIIRNSLKNKNTRLAILEYISRKRLVDTFDDIVALILTPEITQEHQQKAFETLNKLASINKPLPDDFVKHSDEFVRASAINYWKFQNKNRLLKGREAPEILQLGFKDTSNVVQLASLGALKKRREIWASRILSNIILNDSSSIQIRKKALDIYAKNNLKRVERIALKIIDDRSDPLASDAINYVNINNSEVNSNLWDILSDPSSSNSLKLAAAISLKDLDSQKVLATIKKVIH